MEEIISHSEADTEALGERLGAAARAGEVYALDGDLGAGKTAFCRGFARGVGYAGRVTSPTFAIVGEYLGGRLPMFHFDLYRLASEGELEDIGWEDYLARGGVCVVEWAQRCAVAFDGGTVWVKFEKTGECERRIRIEGGDR